MTAPTGNLKVALCDGADCATLRIHAKDRDILRPLLKLFWELGNGQHTTALLNELLSMTFDACSSVTCVVEAVGIERIETIEAEAGPAVEWTQSAEQWHDCCGLLEGLINGSGPGHQYLTNPNGVLVVVAVGEGA